MTNEELSVIKNRMSQEEIMERAKTLRPIAEFNKGHLLCWVDGMQIHNQSYTCVLTPLKPTGCARELGRITTYHKCGYPSLFKPSVDECIYQCPYPEATAFLIIKGSGTYNYDLDCYQATTIYYAADIPDEVRNRKIEW